MNILYLCDRRACEKCNLIECRHTSDITHAKSFENVNGDLIEQSNHHYMLIPQKGIIKEFTDFLNKCHKNIYKINKKENER